MEEERIQKFKDLILNEHYCEDCNELCGIGESFPLEFVAKYIIKLEKENEELKTITQLYNSYEVPDDKHRMVIADTRFFEKGYFKKRFVEKEKILEIINNHYPDVAVQKITEILEKEGGE